MPDVRISVLEYMRHRVRELPAALRERQQRVQASVPEMRRSCAAVAGMYTAPLRAPWAVLPYVRTSKRGRFDPPTASSDYSDEEAPFAQGPDGQPAVFYDSYLLALLDILVGCLPAPVAAVHARPLRHIDSIGMDLLATAEDLAFDLEAMTLGFMTGRLRPEERLAGLRVSTRFNTALKKVVPVAIDIVDRCLHGYDVDWEVMKLDHALEQLLNLFDRAGVEPPTLPATTLAKISPWRQLRYDGSLGYLGSYRVEEKIGTGDSAVVYRATTPTGVGVAIKMERATKPRSKNGVRNEGKMYKNMQGADGIPNLIEQGSNRYFDYIVLPLLGPSLDNILGTCQRRFDEKTLGMVALQMISRVETVHVNGIVHRDIKPDNFLLSGGKVYLIDFGLSEPLPSPGTMVRKRSSASPLGCAPYISPDAHVWHEQFRKDDLQSLGYVFLHFLGKLPWTGLQAAPVRGATTHQEVQRRRFHRIQEAKNRTALARLCRGVPNEVRQFLVYVMRLRRGDEPDYEALRGFFRRALRIRGCDDDGRFLWLGDQEPPTARSRRLRLGAGVFR